MTAARCAACGEQMDAEFASYLRANVGDTPPWCADCIETWIRNSPQLQSAFDAIRGALNPENQREWDAFSFDEKLIRFLKYHDDGLIAPEGCLGYPAQMAPLGQGAAFGELIRLKCAKLRYEDADVLSPES